MMTSYSQMPELSRNIGYPVSPLSPASSTCNTTSKLTPFCSSIPCTSLCYIKYGSSINLQPLLSVEMIAGVVTCGG